MLWSSLLHHLESLAEAARTLTYFLLAFLAIEVARHKRLRILILYLGILLYFVGRMEALLIAEYFGLLAILLWNGRRKYCLVALSVPFLLAGVSFNVDVPEVLLNVSIAVISVLFVGVASDRGWYHFILGK